MQVHSNTKREQDDDQRAICSRVEAVLHGQDNLLGELSGATCLLHLCNILVFC